MELPSPGGGPRSGEYRYGLIPHFIYQVALESKLVAGGLAGQFKAELGCGAWQKT